MNNKKGLKIDIDSDFPIEEKFDIIIPFNFTLYDNGILTVSAYSSTRDIANEFAEKFKDDPLSDEALDWTEKKLVPFVQKHGYKIEEKSMKKIIELYSIKDKEKINRAAILPDSIIIDFSENQENENFNAKECENLTTIDIEEQKEMECICAASIKGNKIVSVASENPDIGYQDDEYSDEDAQSESSVEITVETSPEYRSKGLAASNAALICDRLLDKYDKVIYTCTSVNTASKRAAEHAGFTHFGRAYYFCAYINL